MKDDIKKFRSVCKKNKMTPEQEFEFSEYIHELKDSGYGGSGKGGDFTFQELDNLAKEFLAEKKRKKK